jgi:phosphoglycerol transferase
VRAPALNRTSILSLAAEACAVFAVLFVALEGWRRDFRTPLFFGYDALEYLMQVKGTIENGWWWTHPRLGAPGVFDQLLYPSSPTVDQSIVWMVQLVSSEPGLVINVSWMVMVVLSALIASRCMSLLGVSRPIAIASGLLFALSPYALYRHIDHFSLAIYLAPIPCTVALLIATQRMASLSRGAYWMLLGGSALLGLNYPYYAFFGCFLILVSSLIALAERDARWRTGMTFVGVICLATLVNLTPSLYAWSQQGKPTSIPEKRAAEAEQYGLTIRHLISPVFDHTFPPFRRWNDLEGEARYQLPNENKNSRLGVVGAVGFLALLGGFFAPRLASVVSDGPLFLNAARLTLAALLLATVGGLGSVFNLLISPEIRAYTRITPFIAFFSVLAVAQIAQKLLATTNRKSASWATIGLPIVLVMGLYDQTHALTPLNRDHSFIRQEWTSLTTFVHSLEDRLPPAGGRIFQLPGSSFLSETGRERMLPMDHIKPYLVSKRTHWSYPALDDAIVRWQQQVSRLPAPALAAALVHHGFHAVLVDRNGYADSGRSVLDELGVSDSPDAILSESDRYVAVDLSRVRKTDVALHRLPVVGAEPKAASNRAPNCHATSAHNLEWVAGSSRLDGPPIVVPRSGEFTVVGWAVDQRNESLAGDVDVVVDDKVVPAFYGIDRADVSRYLGSPAYQASGFTAKLAGAEIGPGVRMLSIRILSADRRCYYQGQSVAIIAR